MNEIPKRPVNEYGGSDFVWADYGPSFKQNKTNPNEAFFTLACDAELYNYEHAVATRAVMALHELEVYSDYARDVATKTLSEIYKSGWKP